MAGVLLRPHLCGGLQLGRPRHAITPPHRSRYRVVTKTSFSFGKELERERELREKAELALRAQLEKNKRAEKALEEQTERTDRVERALKRQILIKDLKILGIILAGLYIVVRIFWKLKVVYGL